jgi:[ribosomal protein S18]-alanine N-acetyltransferase
MQNIEVLKMSLEHIDSIMVVENLSFKIPWSRNAFIEEISNNKFARYITAFFNGMIVGYAGLWKVFEEGHITNIAVHPEFRGNGIGSALLEALISSAKSEGILSMTLEVRKSNLVAQSLYGKYGFVVEGLRKAYYSDNGEDAVIMWRNRI